MRLTTRVRFGLRIMIQIASEADAKPLFARRIAQVQGISQPYVDQLLMPLKARGLLRSQRGRYGGYWLARDAEKISVLDILEALEGSMALSECVDKPEECPYSGACQAHRVWKGATLSLRNELAGITLAELRTNGQVPDICAEGCLTTAEGSKRGGC